MVYPLRPEPPGAEPPEPDSPRRRAHRRDPPAGRNSRFGARLRLVTGKSTLLTVEQRRLSSRLGFLRKTQAKLLGGLRVCPGRVGGRFVGWVQPTKCQGLT